IHGPHCTGRGVGVVHARSHYVPPYACFLHKHITIMSLPEEPVWTILTVPFSETSRSYVVGRFGGLRPPKNSFSAHPWRKRRLSGACGPAPPLKGQLRKS